MARPRGETPGDILRGVKRATVLLHRFTTERPFVDLPQAARLLSVPRTTAYRVLRSLEAGGLLIHDPARQAYRLSLSVARLGQVALASVDLRSVSRPHLRRLAAVTGESAFLLVLEGLSAVVIDTVASNAPLRLTYPVGTPWPLHAGASNQVLLAHLPEEVLAQVLAAAPARVTSRTITDPRRLGVALARIRRRGFAHTVGELTPGIAGVAVPILSGGQLMGALAVAGPVSRLKAARVPQVVAHLQQSVLAITEALEGTGNHHTRRGWKG